MFSDFQKQLTYYGVLDDVVDRYPWPSQLNLGAIQHQLITSAIYGKRVLINDGYLLANPILAPDLGDIGHSLTGALLRADVARLFTRRGDAKLAEGIERTASHVATHRALVSDNKKWPQLRGEFERLESDVGPRSIPWPADKNMGEIFYNLMERIAGFTGPEGDRIIPIGLRHDFDEIFKLFRALMNPTYDGARNYWEEACWRHIAGRDIDPHALGTIRMETERVRQFPEYPRVVPFMNIANEVYHMAYSAGAARSLTLGAGELRDAEVGVATAFVSAFPDLAGEDQIGESEGSDMATLECMNQLIITLPSHIQFAGDFAFIYDMRRKSEVVQPANEYLDGLELFSMGNLTFDEALRRRKDYVGALANLMWPHIRLGRGWNMAKKLSDLFIAGATSPLPFMGSWLLGCGIDPLKNLLIERMLKRRVSNALIEEGIVAAQRQGRPRGSVPVPLARKVGLYLGPLKPLGMQRLVENVSAHPAALPLVKPSESQNPS